MGNWNGDNHQMNCTYELESHANKHTSSSSSSSSSAAEVAVTMAPVINVSTWV